MLYIAQDSEKKIITNIQTAKMTVNQSALVAMKDKIIFCDFESPTDGVEWKTNNPMLPMIRNSEPFSQKYTSCLNDRELTVSELIVGCRVAVS